MASLQKFFKGKTLSSVVLALLVIFGAYYLFMHLSEKGGSTEMMSHKMNGAYANKGGASPQGVAGVQPAQPMGQNEVYSSATGVQTSMPKAPSSCSTSNIQNPDELLPKGGSGEWAELNPSGQGELANVNLLKAGYHIGIDTIGQSLRNANQQIRSEPANPQLYVGPWNNTTIEPDFMRPPLEIGAGAAQ